MGHLGTKAPEKKRGVSEGQEGCGQTSQLFWSEQAYEHSAQNEHGA